MPASKTKTKGKGKSKSNQKGKVKPNSQTRAFQLRKEVVDSHSSIEENYLTLAKNFTEIRENKYHIEYYGHPDFQSYIESEVDMSYTKAYSIMKVWEKVKEFGLPEAKVASLGWTKVAALCKVINARNWKTWLKQADELSVRDLTAKVKGESGGSERGSKSSTISVNLRYGSDEGAIVAEALEEAKNLCETKDDGVAMIMICQDWMMAKGQSPERTSLEDICSYVENAYGKRLVPEEETEETEEKSKKKPSAKKGKAKSKAKGKGKGKAKSKGKKESKGAPRKEEKEENEEESAPDASQDLDSLLGIESD